MALRLTRRPLRMISFALGFACYISFAVSLLSLPILFSEGGPVRDAEGSTALLAGLFSIALCVALNIRHEKLAWFVSGRAGLAACLANVSLLSIAQYLSFAFGKPYFTPPILMGFLVALLVLQLTAIWAQACEKLRSEQPHYVIPGAMMISILVGVGTQYLSTMLGAPEGSLAFLAPFTSSLLAIPFVGDTPGEEEPARSGKNMNFAKATRSCGILVIGVLAFYIVCSGVIYSIYTHGMQNYSLQGASHKAILFIFTAFLLAVPWIANKKNVRSTIVQAFVCFIPFCIIALYCVVTFEGSFAGVARGIMLPTRACALFLIWIVIVELSAEESLSLPKLAVTICLPLVFLSRFIMFDAWKAVSELEAYIPLDLLISVFVLVSILGTILGSFWLLHVHRKPRTEEAESMPAAATPAAANDMLARPPSQLTETESALLQEQYDLSQRETEVIHYIACGYTKKKIAETLFLSVNSVSTYSKSAYRKMGVHNRQEVIDLLSRTV